MVHDEGKDGWIDGEIDFPRPRPVQRAAVADCLQLSHFVTADVQVSQIISGGSKWNGGKSPSRVTASAYGVVLVNIIYHDRKKELPLITS